ncbi:hypothetical protein HN873_057392 [Arachis hypogaea]
MVEKDTDIAKGGDPDRTESEGGKVTGGGEQSTVDDQVLVFFSKISDHVLMENEATREVLRTMCVQIRSICGMLSDHGNAIQALIRRIDDGAGDTPTKLAAEVGSTVKDPAIDVNVEHNRRSRKSRTNFKACCPVRPAPAVTQKATKRKSKRSTIEHKGARNNPGKSRKKSPSLKRKLNFDQIDEASSEYSQVWQGAAGTPFTYRTHGHNHVAEEMPVCLSLHFRPLAGMNFLGAELAVAAYIFSRSLDISEVLVENEHSRGDRDTMLTLRPGQQLMEDVINLTCSKLTHDADLPKWFLPTTFAQIALSPVNHSIDTYEFIRTRFMGFADDLWMIYVPMYREHHWYLMIVDLVHCKLMYLDSAKDPSERDGRVAQMKFVAFFIETMFEDNRFWKKGDHYQPHPSSFEVVEPEVGQQGELSNDCGVWVCHWMMHAWLWEDFVVEPMNDQTRMRLALDLVMGDYNPLAREVSRRAVKEWDRHMAKSFGKEKRAKKPIMDAVSPSQSLTI